VERRSRVGEEARTPEMKILPLKTQVLLLLVLSILISSCGGPNSAPGYSVPPTSRVVEEKENTEPKTPEPTGDNRIHYEWLLKECDINEKLIEASGYTKSASQLGRRGYCTEAEEMRERITGIFDSTAPGAKDF